MGEVGVDFLEALILKCMLITSVTEGRETIKAPENLFPPQIQSLRYLE